MINPNAYLNSKTSFRILFYNFQTWVSCPKTWVSWLTTWVSWLKYFWTSWSQLEWVGVRASWFLGESSDIQWKVVIQFVTNWILFCMGALCDCVFVQSDVQWFILIALILGCRTTHPKPNSPKLWPTHPNRLVNSPKFLVISPKF